MRTLVGSQRYSVDYRVSIIKWSSLVAIFQFHVTSAEGDPTFVAMKKFPRLVPWSREHRGLQEEGEKARDPSFFVRGS